MALLRTSLRWGPPSPPANWQETLRMDFPWISLIETCLLTSPPFGGVSRGIRRVHSLCSGTRSSEQKPLRLLSPRKPRKPTDTEATGGGADDAAAQGILGVNVSEACSEESMSGSFAAATAAVMRGCGGAEHRGERAPWR